MSDLRGHAKEIEPFPVTGPDGAQVQFAHDEHCRPGTTLEALAGLRTVFKADGVIHAGNSSGIVDGAAAVLVASERAAKVAGLPRRARIVSTAVAGSDPVLMLTGPTSSTRKALARAGLSVKDIDLWESNEAFAPVPMVVAQELGIPPIR
jgi:acetyl-CoA acetyltransferase